MLTLPAFASLVISSMALLHLTEGLCPQYYLGDGYCDSGCNSRTYQFDDGDCCEKTCLSRPRPWPCGANGYQCNVNITEPAPSWFTRDTKLCYRWRPDGDGEQCGGGVPRVLCAHVGSYTTNYRDDTDNRTGGCRMQWKISSPFAPVWFRKVHVCFRWYAVGGGGQCGGTAAPAVCTPVGYYTAEYRDDTDGRGGGCRMSWMLRVPAIAPQWLHDIQLCYKWHPDGDEGQCGGRVGRELCARANDWTTYYRDDTDERSGGCQMAWSLKKIN